MANIIEHAHTFQYSFEERPLGAVDSLVLCQLSYLRFEHCGLQKQDRLLQLGSLAVEVHNQQLLHNMPVSKGAIVELMRAVAQSPRYRWLCATQYVNSVEAESNKQFSATTFLLEDGTVFIAFRGTDKSIIGWKENFTLLYSEETQAQQAAVAYLQRIAQRFPGALYVGGHSKGGNLAVYAAAMADPAIQERIVAVYNNDGPGFSDVFLEGEGYRSVQKRIHKTVPEISVVGMLFRDQENYTVVESTGFEIYQHDMLTWVVKDGELCAKESVHKTARKATAGLNKLIDILTPEQRKAIVEALFEVMDSTNAESVSSLLPDAIWNAPAVVKAVSGFSPETKSLLHDILKLVDIQSLL